MSWFKKQENNQTSDMNLDKQKAKVHKYSYTGLFNEGDEVTLENNPQTYEISKTISATVKEDAVGIITQKQDLTSIGSTMLIGNEGYYKYNIRFEADGYTIELCDVPEYLIDFPDE